MLADQIMANVTAGRSPLDSSQGPPPSTKPNKSEDEVEVDEVDELDEADGILHYTKKEKSQKLTCNMKLKLTISLFFPFLAFCFNLPKRNSKTGGCTVPYPEMINLHVLRVVDFMAAVGMFISLALTFSAYVFEIETLSFKIVTGLSVAPLFFDKCYQVVSKPAWKAHRIIAYNVFGDEFLPVGSVGRRAQMAIFACETLLVFDPIMEVIFDAADAGRDAPYIFLVSFKVFLLFFYLSMAIGAWCPVWSFAGLLCKFGLIPHPKGQCGSKTICLLPKDNCKKLAKKSTYFFRVDEESQKITHLRYGRWGPYLQLKEPKTSNTSKVTPSEANAVQETNASSDAAPKATTSDAAPEAATSDATQSADTAPADSST